MDEKIYRNMMGKFATGVTVVATENKGKIYGMTANAFMSVSLTPKLVTISINNDAKILENIIETSKFSINFLSSEQQELSEIFANRIHNDYNIVFERLDGIPTLPNAMAQIACILETKYVVGDHTLLVGEVTDVYSNMNENTPLIFYEGTYHSLKENSMKK